jgi:hypothetical protein
MNTISYVKGIITKESLRNHGVLNYSDYRAAGSNRLVLRLAVAPRLVNSDPHVTARHVVSVQCALRNVSIHCSSMHLPVGGNVRDRDVRLGMRVEVYDLAHQKTDV